MRISASASYLPADIVVVPFPYSDRFAEKVRPALVVSNDRLARIGFIWIVMITSAKRVPLSDDVLIRELEPTGLSAHSVVRPAKIACTEASRLIGRIGRLRDDEAAAVFLKLHDFLASSDRPQSA